MRREDANIIVFSCHWGSGIPEEVCTVLSKASATGLWVCENLQVPNQ